uniref:Uncharacterized protein n=1 Tax=Poecilia mexicana TaxID=48701 RepID=A0A3B3YMG0_9TELE
MEHSFRIAIWMFLLLGFLQARPALDGLINDIGFTLLRNDVSCVSKEKNCQGYCPGNSLMVMKDGLEQAKKECKDTNNRVRYAIDAWDMIKEHYKMVSLDTSCCFLIQP